MKLIDTTFLSVISTSAKMLAALVINKAVAVFAGPGGIALIGQMQNVIQMVNIFAQGGVNVGVTKYTAEYHKQPTKIFRVWSSSFRIIAVCSLIVGLLLIFLSDHLSLFILKESNYGYIFIIFGFTVLLFALNQLLLSILNGLKEIKALTLISLIQSVYALIFTTILVIFLGIDGALIGLVTNQSIVFFYALYKLRNHNLIRLNRFLQYWDKDSFRKLLSYSGMAITSAIVTPLTYLYIRSHLGTELSWDQAGYWQSMVYISLMYVMVISTALNTYYLPRLSEISDKKELREELKIGYKTLLPIVIILSSAVYFSRDFIIDILFSSDFNEVRYLFKWQLIGDVIKISAYLLSFLMLAKAMTAHYIITELVFCSLFAAISVCFINNFGTVGVTYAYAINNIFYFLTMIIITKKIRY